MTLLDRDALAVATDPSDGRAHPVWNEDGRVFHAYDDAICGAWVDAGAIPGARSGFDLKIATGVGVTGADGAPTRGLTATWTVGEGNAA